jgi:16S rRNA (guanine527-N7)-methyltransferase
MFHVKHEGLTPHAAGLGVALSEEQVGLLEEFEHLLEDRAVGLGMIAATDAPRLRDRHVLDSLRAAAAVTAEDRSAADLGSGAGLPGIVVAIACPRLAVTLIEVRRARVAFLELATERLGLPNATVLPERVEEATGHFDLCFARAYGDPERSWRDAQRLVGTTGRLVYFAGASFDPRDVPSDARMAILPAPPVASAGPLVIMSRQ